jgi:hypothetical protein
MRLSQMLVLTFKLSHAVSRSLADKLGYTPKR